MPNVPSDKFYLNRSRDAKGRIVSKMARKKICPSCGRLLWKKKDYYQLPSGNPYTYCKDCQRNRSRNSHQWKQPNGIRLDENGVIKEYINGKAHIYWSPMMIKWLKENYATTKNDELASELGVCVCSMRKKAKSLGLSKDKEWMNGVAKDNSILGSLAMKRKFKKKSLPITGKLI